MLPPGELADGPRAAHGGAGAGAEAVRPAAIVAGSARPRARRPMLRATQSFLAELIHDTRPSSASPASPAAVGVPDAKTLAVLEALARGEIVVVEAERRLAGAPAAPKATPDA